jgi:hypothetical protein
VSLYPIARHNPVAVGRRVFADPGHDRATGGNDRRHYAERLDLASVLDDVGDADESRSKVLPPTSSIIPCRRIDGCRALSTTVLMHILSFISPDAVGPANGSAHV